MDNLVDKTTFGIWYKTKTNKTTKKTTQKTKTMIPKCGRRVRIIVRFTTTYAISAYHH